MAVTRFKICGVRRAEDVRAAVAAGASAVGLCLYPPSPRAVTVDEAADLARQVPPWVERVILVVDQTPERAAELAAQVGAGWVQWHGTAEPDELAALPVRVMLARPAVRGETVAELRRFAGAVEAVLLDAAVAGQHGGTGRQADWAAACEVREAYPDLSVVLAGGLTPENVVAAVRAVRPYAVDVASGVESAPGVKDAARIHAFGAAVRAAGGDD
ncbi:MAG: phosphoribosylanthranilate isomerase [Armatimonadetes bacterium]|nr:phosphoribosylanthranilate isomerase [Armatimonadota bacterium]